MSDTVLLEAVVKEGLGRPWTWANHEETFLSRGLVDDEMKLTDKGRAWVVASPPELLDPRISAAIERACEHAPAGLTEDPEREPWETLSGRIMTALPPAPPARMPEADDPETHTRPHAHDLYGPHTQVEARPTR